MTISARSHTHSIDIPAIKRRAAICDVWSALGGGRLRRNRGRAFWRDGDGYSVAVDARRNLWHDFVTAEGGDTIALVMCVRQCSFRDALAWLTDFLGIDVSPIRRDRAPATDRDWPTDLRWATWWHIAAVGLAEHALETLPDTHPERQGLTEFLASIQLGDLSVVTEYRQWRRRCPRLTHAMARAGQLSDARMQRRLAHWIVENGRS